MGSRTRKGSTKTGDDSTKTAGIDIGRAYLDIALYGSPEALRLLNDAVGHTALLRRVAETGVMRVGPEASGGYERGVLAVPREVALLQPRQVQADAQYRQRRARNDRLDAQLIAAYRRTDRGVRGAPDPRYAALAEHLRLIEQIEADLARLRTRAEAYREQRLLRWITAGAARLEPRLKAELLLLTTRVTEQDDLRQRLAVIESVDGIGRRTALSLLVLMPELGTLDRAQVASLAGLAPFDRDSGTHRGQRRIAGGRGRVRRALYAAAFPASFRWNTRLVAPYQRLRGRGKPHKSALVACARKLLTFVNAVVGKAAPCKNIPPSPNDC